MFVLCPHCHFLVGLDPRTGAPPAQCPKCGRPLRDPHEAGGEPAQNQPQAPATAEVPRTLPPEPQIERASPLPAQPAAALPQTSDAATPARIETTPPSASRAATGTPLPSSSPQSLPAAPPARLDADAMIAAMAAKAPRRAGPARKKTEPARPPAATMAPPTATTPIAHPPLQSPAGSSAVPPPGDAATAATRPTRGRRKAATASASGPSAQVAAPAAAAPHLPRQPRTPVAARWWMALMHAWRARAAATAARKAAKAAAVSTPAFDPLAASVRNRARMRAAAQDAAATSAPASAAGPSAATPAASALPTGNMGAPASTPAPSIPAEAPASESTSSASADDASVAPAPADALPVPAAPAPAPSAEAPFVERRRNPDVPPPPGVVPSHPLRRRTDAPSFARAHAAMPARRLSWRWPAAVVALSLLLVLQLLLAQRDTLATDARWRPAVSALCATLRCRLPSWREPAAFTMLSRDVRAHPSAPGTLLINASFRNDARWPQPWPRVLLTLSNVDGRIVGARAFTAGEYLGTDAIATPHELAPGQTAAITLAVVEPAPDIVAFSFDFR